MNNLRKSALLRWKRELDKDLSRVKNDRKSLMKKAAICGFLAGDGSVQIRKERKDDKFYRYQLDLYADDKEMLDTYMSFVRQVYNLKPTVKIRDNMYCARTSRRFIVQDLMSLCKFGLYKWDFPLRLFKINGARENWLRAFFSAEGYVGKKVIKIQSVNIKSIKRVMDFLNELKIKSNYCEYVSKNPNHSKVGMIFINERKSRLIYYKKIGFWHKRKNASLKKTLGL